MFAIAHCLVIAENTLKGPGEEEEGDPLHQLVPNPPSPSPGQTTMPTGQNTNQGKPPNFRRTQTLLNTFHTTAAGAPLAGATTGPNNATHTTSTIATTTAAAAANASTNNTATTPAIEDWEPSPDNGADDPPVAASEPREPEESKSNTRSCSPLGLTIRLLTLPTHPFALVKPKKIASFPGTVLT
ncbi:hypothetical protein FRC17_005770, partial [Serendipita sp. 399]